MSINTIVTPHTVRINIVYFLALVIMVSKTACHTVALPSHFAQGVRGYILFRHVTI